MKGIEPYLEFQNSQFKMFFNTNEWKEWIVFKSNTDVIKFVKSVHF